MIVPSLPGIFRFSSPPEEPTTWAAYLQQLGFGAVALPGTASPGLAETWQSLGFETHLSDRGNLGFASLLTHLFCAAESDDVYIAIFNEFIGTSPETPIGQTGLILGESLATTSAVKRFHDAAEAFSEKEPGPPLPGLAHPSLDAQARIRLIAAVSDPVEWRSRVLRWKEYARDVRVALGEAATLTLENEYRLFQALLMSWPATASDTLEDSAALREAAITLAGPFATDDLPAVQVFTEALFMSKEGSLFRKAFIPFAESIAEHAAALALTALVLQCAVPGAPEILDGEELGAGLALPDRVRRLEEISGHPADLAKTWSDGRLRLFVLRELLALRTRIPALFGRTKYLPQKARGKFSDHCLAFSRQCPGYVLLVAVPLRLPAMARPLEGDPWELTALEICGITQIHWTNVFTGAKSTGPYITLSDAFHDLPVAVFLATTGDHA